MDLTGTFGGLVEDNKDPEKLGRLKVRVAHVYGAVGGVFGAIATNDLPWALPAGLPNGQSQQSGGADWLPEVGDQVLVRFLDAEPEKPVWEWFMQTLKGAEDFPLHAYEEQAGGGVGNPKRGAWVRYGHTVEWNADGLILTTSKGYRLLLTDASSAGSDGDISLATQGGQSFEFDDAANTATLNVNEDYQLNVGSQMLALCDSISLQSMTKEIELISGGKITFQSTDNFEATVSQDWMMAVAGATTFDLTGALTVNSNQSISFAAAADVSLKAGAALSLASVSDMALEATGALSLSSQEVMSLSFLKLSLGTGSSPFVLGDQLLDYLTTLVTLLISHTHTGVQSGSGTSGPMVPALVPPTSALLSSVITGT